MEKARIIIVEDEPIIRMDIQSYLSKLGYVVLEALSSGEEAIEKVEQLKPDLILMDILLSDKMDGIDAAKIIMEKFDVPVVYLTAHAESSTLQRARATAPFGYIVKPVTIDKLYSTIEMAIQRHELGKKLMESEKRYRMLVETMNDGLCMLDDSAHVAFVNERFCDKTGYSHEEAIGRSIFDFFDEHNRRIVVEQLAKRRMGEEEAYELAWSLKNGGIMHSIVSPRALFDDHGTFQGSFAVITDITDRRSAEEKLRESEERYRLIVENMPLLICRLLPKTGDITFVNDEYCNYFNKSYAELVGKSFLALIPESEHQEVKNHFESLNKDNPVITYEHQVITPDGVRWQRWIDQALFDEHDNVIEYQSIGMDITERKQAEEALREERDRAQTYLDVVGAIIVVLDHEGRVTLINRRGCEVLGYSEEEILGKNWIANFIPERERNRISRGFDRAIAGKVHMGDLYENPVLTKSHEERIILWNNAVIRDDDGNLISIISSGEDITERKQAEEAMQESEEKLSEIVQGSSIPTFVIDSNHVITHWNRACENLTGYSADEMINSQKQWMPFYSDKRPIMADFVASSSAEKDIESYYSRIFKKSSVIEGAYEAEDFFPHLGEGGRWLFFTAAPLRNSEGRIIGAIETLQDITEQKTFENSLQESEKKYRMLVETMNDGIVMVDENNLVTFTNDKFCQMTGCSKDEIIGHGLENLIFEEDRQKFLDEMEKRKVGYQEKYEIALQPSRGNRVYTIVSPRLILDENNGYAGSFGIFTDITERREMEEELRHSEERYRTIFETSGSAMIIIDEDMTISQVNNETEKITGYSRDEIIGNKKFTDFLKKNQLERSIIYHHLRREEPDSVPHQYEFNFINRSGEERDGIASISMIPGTNASVVSIQDITERRRLEKEILNISMLEQQRIGQDLHDDLGQILTGTGFFCELLIKKLSEKSIPEAADAREIHKLIMEAKEHTRVLSKGLCPVDIGLGGITTAIKQIVDNTEKVFSIRCTFDYDSDILIEDSTVETQLYYIVQEAVTNSIKHGKAENLNIVLKKVGKKIHLNIRDDGIGIPEAIDLAKGLGLRIMLYRAGVIGASINIYRNGERGTVVSCIMQN